MKIYDIIFWIFFILAIIFFVWYMFGKSPTIEQTLLVFILGFVITNYANMKSLRTDHDNLRNNFKLLAQDFKEHVKHE